MENHQPTDPRQLKEKLLKEYKNHELEDLSHGKEVKVASGTCFCFETTEKIKIHIEPRKKLETEVLNNLKLLKGIGIAKEQSLKAKGFENLRDLREHPQHGDDAQQVCELLDDDDLKSLSDYISKSFAPSHPTNLLCLSQLGPENMVFMDIETLGLDGVPLILIGVAIQEGKKVKTIQYLLRNLEEEAAVLECYANLTKPESILVTFNGRNFDAPFITRRMHHHQLKKELPSLHLDLLFPSRSRWKNQLPNCQLQTLEKHLYNQYRVDDVPGSMVPDFYKTYLDQENIGPLIPIIEHNRIDVLTLIRLLGSLQIE